MPDSCNVRAGGSCNAGRMHYTVLSRTPRVVQVVEFGRYEMDTWYYSPYPEPYASATKLYLCEYTLKYFRKKKTLLRHLAKLDIRHPPGGWLHRDVEDRGELDL